MARSRQSRNLDRWVRRHQGKHFCKCGCGYTIEIKREHHKKSVGIPAYIKGHNLQISNNDEEAVTPKKPSIWDKLSPEEQQRRLDQLQSFRRDDENPAWKGGRRADEHGYIQVRLPDHPFAKDGYIYEHRLFVEERTRKYDPENPLLVEFEGEKYLCSSCVVHHIDEVKTNNNAGNGPNDIGNLMLLADQAAHAFIHKSPLPMEERLRRIALGIHHSKNIDHG